MLPEDAKREREVSPATDEIVSLLYPSDKISPTTTDLYDSTPSAGPSTQRFNLSGFGLDRSTPRSSSSKPSGKVGRYSVSRTSACERCRVAKARCSQDRPTCSRCQSQSLTCVYDSNRPRATSSARPRRRRETSDHTSRSPSRSRRRLVPDIVVDTPTVGARSRSHSPALLSSTGDPTFLNDKLASKQELWQLLDTYFTHVYPVQAMSFVHKSQLYRRVEEGRASPLLIKSMCAVSARFLPSADKQHTEGGYLPSVWCQETKIGIILDTDRFSFSKLAAILCILNHDFNCGRTGSAWVFVAIAVRMARAMGLNVESTDPNLPFIEKETRRRLIWAIFCADCSCSAGWPEYMLLEADEMQVYLPSDENSFTLGIERPGQRLSDLVDGWKDPVFPGGSGVGSLMTRWIWLMALRVDLLRYVWRLTDHDKKPWEGESKFAIIQRRLQHWKDTLPAELNFSVDNLHLRKGTNELDSLAVMHICFDIVHSTLYRITLPSFPESAKPGYLAQAPRDWIHRLRLAANTRAVAVRQKMTLLERHFPDHIPTTRLYNLYIFGSLRVQLQYYALACPDGIPDPKTYEETAAGFEVMMQIVGKMIRYYVDNRKMLRDMLQILARHGYHIPSKWEDELRTTDGVRTPIHLGYAVSGIPTLPPRQSDLRSETFQPEGPSAYRRDEPHVKPHNPDPVADLTQTLGPNLLESWADLIHSDTTAQASSSTLPTHPFGNAMSGGNDTLSPAFNIGESLPFFGAYDPFVGAVPGIGSQLEAAFGHPGQNGSFQSGPANDTFLNTWTAETSDIDWDALLSEQVQRRGDDVGDVAPEAPLS